MSRLPTLRHASRRRPLLLLLVAGLLRGALAFVTVLLFACLAEARLAPGHFIAAVLAVAAGLGGLRALETVQAERLGQAYVHSLRRRLVAQLAVTATQPRRRGSQWLRMTGDLNGLRRWISQGLARSVAAAAMLVSLCSALLWTLPWLAALVGLVLAVSGLLMWALQARLLDRERALRRARARLANAVERQMPTPDRPQPDNDDRGARRVARRSREVATASVARARVHAGPRAWTDAAPLALVAASVAAAAMLAEGNTSLLPALALMGLLAQPLRDLGLAWEMRQSHRVAAANVLRLLAPHTDFEPAATGDSSVPDAQPTTSCPGVAPATFSSSRIPT